MSTKRWARPFCGGRYFWRPRRNTRYVTLADQNGDLYPDIVAANRRGDTLSPSFVCLNNRHGAFPACEPLRAESATSIAAEDLGGDGSPDLVFIDERKKAAFIMLNRGSRQLGQPAPLPGPSRVPYALAMSDLNRDGQLDIVVGYVELPGSVYFNEAKGRTFREVP